MNNSTTDGDASTFHILPIVVFILGAGYLCIMFGYQYDDYRQKKLEYDRIKREDKGNPPAAENQT